MLKRTFVGLAALAFSLAAFGDDKIGNTKAPEIFKKVAAELAKKKGYHVTEKATVPGLGGRGGGGGMPGMQDQSFDGIVKYKDFAALKGSAEVWCKGSVTLTKNPQGKYVEPKDIEGQDGVTAGAVRNPAVVYADALRFSGPATFTGDEKFGEIDCKIAETWADTASTEQQLKDVVKNIKLPPQAGNMDVMQIVDKKKSQSSYKIWVGKEDLLFHKIEWTVSVAIDKTKIPGGFGAQLPDKLDMKVDIEIKDYDKDLDVEIPKEIKARFGIKDEPKK